MLLNKDKIVLNELKRKKKKWKLYVKNPGNPFIGLGDSWRGDIVVNY